MGGEDCDLFQEKTQEQIELQMRQMKKVQTFERFKKEVRSLIKNHYKAKINDKVHLKVSQKL